jgi:hypothetical protein
MAWLTGRNDARTSRFVLPHSDIPAFKTLDWWGGGGSSGSRLEEKIKYLLQGEFQLQTKENIRKISK